MCASTRLRLKAFSHRVFSRCGETPPQRYSLYYQVSVTATLLILESTALKAAKACLHGSSCSLLEDLLAYFSVSS